jgi:glycosyltransferase involved in cell wall biosynthesis
MRNVLFITRVVQKYRTPFHEQVRGRLAEVGIRYGVAQGEAEPALRARNDTVTLPWAHVVQNRFVGPGNGKLLWQPLASAARNADLVIVGQENKYLLNYLLQLGRGSLFGKVALWGHGRNFQARNPDGAAERWKRQWATRADWWFAYTEATRHHLLSLGFPGDRVTVFNNAVDTATLRKAGASISDEEATEFAACLGATGSHVAIFVGGLYPDKRLKFLIQAADLVRTQVPDFQLVVVGGGEERERLDALAATRPWVIVVGPRFGREKALLMRAAKLFLMPGLLGLAVLDAMALGLPVVTTRFPYHSPEIAYLREGATGLIVERWQDEAAYAHAVVALLADGSGREAMARQARADAERYTIEAMAERFADGVLAALAAPRR